MCREGAKVLRLQVSVLAAVLAAAPVADRAATAKQVLPAAAPLRVSDNGRYLVRADGTPFFWLGDTAWLLSQRTSRDDAELYLATRARQGFTVVQATIVNGEEQVVGTLGANAYGDQPFVAGNPAAPSVTPGAAPDDGVAYDYWDHLDFVVTRAAAHGLTLGLAPLFVGLNGDGYRYLTLERAFEYGRFLGARYGSQSHLFWILGGDNTPDTDARRMVWHEVARGITTATAGVEDYTRTLMTYHVNGQNSSSQMFHQAPWLDFNMIQVWGDEPLIFPRVSADYQLTPPKPTVLGEGSYEDSPQYPSGPVGPFNIRRQAYWTYFAGGLYTFGNTNTWNFGSFPPAVTGDWRRALDSAGAEQLSVLGGTFRSLEWWTLVPDLSILAGGSGGGPTQNAALRSTTGNRILVYAASPSTLTLRLDGLRGTMAAATWIDPRTGARSAAGHFATSQTASFTTPAEWADALLLLEVAL
jgi:hypothetical protein